MGEDAGTFTKGRQDARHVGVQQYVLVKW